VEAAHLDAREQPAEEARALRELGGGLGLGLEHALEDREARVHRRRLLLLRLRQPAHVLHQQRRRAVVEQRGDEHEQVVGRGVLALRHLAQQIHHVDRDVAVLVRQQTEQRGHAPRAHERRVQLGRCGEHVQPLELLVELELAVHEAFGLVAVLGAHLHVLVDPLLDTQHHPLHRVLIEARHLHLRRYMDSWLGLARHLTRMLHGLAMLDPSQPRHN